jgi:hypothetical protein
MTDMRYSFYDEMDLILIRAISVDTEANTQHVIYDRSLNLNQQRTFLYILQ